MVNSIGIQFQTVERLSHFEYCFEIVRLAHLNQPHMQYVNVKSSFVF